MFDRFTIETSINKRAGYKKPIYCTNCNGKNHKSKKCYNPIISLGVILVKLDIKAISGMTPELLEKFRKSLISYSTYGDQQITDVSIVRESQNCDLIFSQLKDSVKFLMVQRKHTVGFIEFVRGNYDVDKNFGRIVFLLSQMTKEELHKLKTLEFKDLWNDVWRKYYESPSSDHLSRYEKSKKKFNIMKNKTDMNLDYYIKNTTLQWRNSEWGFPKGRRNYRESDYKCAIREFKEETNLENKDFCMLTKIRPLEETITGTNGKKYKYVYYVGMINNSENELEIDKTNPDQVSEIGDIKWQTYLEAIDSIRVNRNNRKEILSKLFFFIVNKINHLLK